MLVAKYHQQLIDEVNHAVVPYGACAYWWLGQHSFIVKLGDVVVYIDPYLSPNPARNVAPFLRPEDVTNANIVIGTHDHSDHIDRPIWPALAAASPNAVFVMPMQVREELAGILGLPDSQAIGIDEGIGATVDGIKITAIPAAHELLVKDPVTGYHECLGVVLEGNGFCLYHAGDTCIYEGIQARLREWQIDLAMLPINGRDAVRLKSGCIGNMTYQEAVDLAGSIRPEMTIPCHWDMFTGNMENPILFLDYIQVKYPHLQAHIPVHAEYTLVQSNHPK